jgi:inorganic pyrophosphatase
MRGWGLLAIGVLSCGVGTAQAPDHAPEVLPAAASTVLARSLHAAAAHARHVWRDTPATNADGTINAYIEIARGDRRKWELDMGANARAIDRVLPAAVGGYPVNYGFVPQTVSYDGDPFDALVLGPPLSGGAIVRGVIVGLMHMTDEKGLDSKVVLSAVGSNGQPLHALSAPEKQRIGEFFKYYKRYDPGAFSDVPGWGSISAARSFVAITHGFFLQCRQRAGQPCRVSPAAKG